MFGAFLFIITVMFYVYILFSEKLNRYYVGTTDDIVRRLDEHNDGVYRDSYTSKGVPWVLKVYFSCATSKRAYDLERFIKKMKSRVFIEQIILNPEIVEDILKKM